MLLTFATHMMLLPERTWQILYLRTVVHKRIDIIGHGHVLGNWPLHKLGLVVVEILVQNPDEGVTVRPLLFVPQSEGMSDFVHWRSELRNETDGVI